MHFVSSDPVKKIREGNLVVDVEISVVLVIWHNKQYLKLCLDALERQTIRSKEVIEVIVVHNGDDYEASYFEGYELKFQFLNFEENVGFAKANNEGVKLCSSEWVALLNVDAFPQEGWLEHLHKATQHHPDVSTFASKQIQYNNPDLLDGIGDAYHMSGLVWRQAFGQSVADTHIESKEIFSACAAAVLYKKSTFEAVGGFDEDYFSYSEDVDLGFRLRLNGYKCLYVPDAVVHHVGSASTGGQDSDFAVYHGHRNLVWTFFKNMPMVLLLICLPFHVALNLVSLVYFSLKGRTSIIFKAKGDALRALPDILKKRKLSLQDRKLSILDLWRFLEKGLKNR